MATNTAHRVRETLGARRTLQRGRRLYRAGRYDEAARALEDAIDAGASGPQAHVGPRHMSR